MKPALVEFRSVNSEAILDEQKEKKKNRGKAKADVTTSEGVITE